MSSVAQQPLDSRPAPIDLLTTLAQANQFSLSALAANRAGRLTPEQAEGLRWRARRKLLLSLVAMGAALLIVVPVGISGGGSTLVGLVVFGTIITLAGGQQIATSLKTLHDTTSGAVAMIEGVVTKSNSVDADEVGNGATTYYYKVDGQKFVVSPAAYAVLPSGITCRLYYSPRGKQLLSIEPV